MSPFKWRCVSKWDLSTCHYLYGWARQSWGVVAPKKEKYLLIIEANAKQAALGRSRPLSSHSLPCPRPPRWGIWSLPASSPVVQSRNLGATFKSLSSSPPDPFDYHHKVCLPLKYLMNHLLVSTSTAATWGQWSIISHGYECNSLLIGLPAFSSAPYDPVDTRDQKSHSIKQIWSRHTPAWNYVAYRLKFKLYSKPFIMESLQLRSRSENSQDLTYVRHWDQEGTSIISALTKGACHCRQASLLAFTQ